MADARKKLGDWGEALAARHLVELGYQIVAKKWRCQAGEIDLVVQAGSTLVFVEVKTRRGDRAGTPEEGLTAAKARKLLLLAQHYLLQHDLDVAYRIDMVAVELDGSGRFLRCEHIPNAVSGW
jgi:putative endonuclease